MIYALTGVLLVACAVLGLTVRWLHIRLGYVEAYIAERDGEPNGWML